MKRRTFIRGERASERARASGVGAVNRAANPQAAAAPAYPGAQRSAPQSSTRVLRLNSEAVDSLPSVLCVHQQRAV